MLKVEEYKLIKLKIQCAKLETIIYRNIAFPVAINNFEALFILQESIPGSKIVSFNEEKVVSVLEEKESRNGCSKGLIDKYWIDGLEYVLVFEEEKDPFKHLLIVSLHDTNKYELLTSIASVVPIKNNTIIDELNDCWILRKEYSNLLLSKKIQNDNLQK